MINSITDDFIKWLERYIHSDTCEHKAAASVLLSQMKHVDSITSFHELLTGAIASHKTHFLPNKDIHDTLLSYIESLHRDVAERQKFDPAPYIQALDDLECHEKTTDLLVLLKRVLANEHSLLHGRMLGLVHLLKKPQTLQESLHYLATLEDNPRPKNPREGSFDAMKAINKEHGTCLQLLRNTSGSFTEGKPQCLDTNVLLQNLIIIYHDLNTDKPEQNPTPDGSWAGCRLL